MLPNQPQAPISMSPPSPAQNPDALTALHSHPKVDRNNAMQTELLNRLSTVTPQDKQALMTGISPPAMAVLKKLLPELAHLMSAGAGPNAPPTTGAAADDEMAEMESDAGDTDDEDEEQAEAPPPPPGATALRPSGNNLRPSTRLANA